MKLHPAFLHRERGCKRMLRWGVLRRNSTINGFPREVYIRDDIPTEIESITALIGDGWGGWLVGWQQQQHQHQQHQARMQQEHPAASPFVLLTPSAVALPLRHPRYPQWHSLPPSPPKRENGRDRSRRPPAHPQSCDNQSVIGRQRARPRARPVNFPLLRSTLAITLRVPRRSRVAIDSQPSHPTHSIFHTYFYFPSPFISTKLPPYTHVDSTCFANLPFTHLICKR